jgi:hypothetical protein
MSKTIEHPNGLLLALPAGYKATAQPDGFLVEEDPPGGNRLNLRIDVRLLAVSAALPNMGRQVVPPARDFGWALRTRDGGGSGGPEHTLTACEALQGQRALCLVQTKLGKHGAPDFELWQIAAGASAQR